MRIKPEYEPTTIPIMTSQGSVPSQRSARYPRRVPEMIDPKKLPPATQPPIEDAPTEEEASDARGVSGFIL